MESKIIKKVPLDIQIEKDYIQGNLEIIENRAIPDVRDGLKPVQRRLLYSMYEEGYRQGKSHVKSAKIVGNTMGNYHAHGDSGIYEALVNMTQPWKTHIQPTEGKGNYGNRTGYPAAAMRYTENRLSEFGTLFTKDIKEGIVEFKNNYDDTRKEPKTLPITIPYLLINGASGLAAGMSANILPHNPREAINATIAYIKDPNITVDQLMEIMPSPDFPRGGEILNGDEIKNYYLTGKQGLYVRGDIEIDKDVVRIVQVPYSLRGGTGELAKSITEKILNGKLKHVVGMAEDFTGKDGVKIEVKINPSSTGEEARDELYANTDVEIREPGDFIVIHNGHPKYVSLKDYLEYFTEYQNKLVINRHRLLIENSEKRLDLVEGLIKATTDPKITDVIIEMVRKANTKNIMRNVLIHGWKNQAIDWKTKKAGNTAKRFNFTPTQAEAILDTPLHRLSKIDAKELERERKSLKMIIKDAKSLIDSDIKRKNYLIKQLEESLELFNDSKYDRKTTISNKGRTTIEYVERIVPVDIVVDKFNYIRKLENGSDKGNESVYNKTLNSNDAIAVYATDGYVYNYYLEDIELHTPKAKGELLSSRIPLGDHLLLGIDGDVLVFSEVENDNKTELLQVTSNGRGKLVSVSELTPKGTAKTKKIKGIGLDKDSSLVYSKTNDPKKNYIVCVSESGKVKKIAKKELKSYGKGSKGTYISKPSSGDKVAAAYQVSNKDKLDLFGGKVSVKDIPVSKSTHTMKVL